MNATDYQVHLLKQRMSELEDKVQELVDREALAQPTAQNFCSRCGKRTPDLTTIHTCTPPRGLEMT